MPQSEMAAQSVYGPQHRIMAGKATAFELSNNYCTVVEIVFQ